jgi:hypothetical protein
VNTPLFKTFVASIRTSRFHCFIIRNVRDIDEFRLNVFGPVIEFLRAVPQKPAVGAENAPGFKYCPVPPP